MGLAGLLAGGLLLVSCSDDPQAPPATSSISGTVVYAQTGEPVPDVDVIMERCAGSGQMMMDEEWDHAQHTMTGVNGMFHFEYRYEHEHRYRLRAGEMNAQNMCYLNGGTEKGIVLRIENQ